MKVPVALLRFLPERGRPRTEEPPPDELEPEAVELPEPEPEPEPKPEPVLALAPPLPEPEPQPAPGPEPAPAVVPLVPRDPSPRSWNLWELERLAEKLDGGSAREERRLLLLHLREFADPAGDLPLEFDPLIREAFGESLAGLPR